MFYLLGRKFNLCPLVTLFCRNIVRLYDLSKCLASFYMEVVGSFYRTEIKIKFTLKFNYLYEMFLRQ